VAARGFYHAAQPGPASLDRRGTFYVADAANNLRQFGRDGQR
jgi:hypothetical protein